MTPEQALDFVREHGIVLESAAGEAPSLAAAIAGEPLRGSWWTHPKGKVIFAATRAVRDSDDVATCRALGGKITFIHRRLWPALARLADELDAAPLARVHEEHLPSGKHALRETPFPGWLPNDAREDGAMLGAKGARAQLAALLA